MLARQWTSFVNKVSVGLECDINSQREDTRASEDNSQQNSLTSQLLTYMLQPNQFPSRHAYRQSLAWLESLKQIITTRGSRGSSWWVQRFDGQRTYLCLTKHPFLLQALLRRSSDSLRVCLFKASRHESLLIHLSEMLPGRSLESCPDLYLPAEESSGTTDKR